MLHHMRAELAAIPTVKHQVSPAANKCVWDFDNVQKLTPLL